MMRLAVMDWGIGGFGFWQEWRKLRPGEGCVYFSDAGFTPYGKVPESELRGRLESVFRMLSTAHGVTHVVVACNAASTVIQDEELIGGVTVRGIIQLAAEGVKEVIPPGKLTVTGGRRTIASGIFQQLLPGYEVTGLVGQPLSAVVEAGRTSGEDVEELVGEILRGSDPNLLLACTHYVALAEIIGKKHPEIRLHDPIPGIARRLAAKWPPMGGEDFILTTGEPGGMVGRAEASFGAIGGEAVKVVLEK